MIVCKFGGSSVADEKQIMKVKDILEANKDRKVAIVSAPGKRNKEDRKITDMLYECNSLVQKNQSCKRVFAEIGKRYLDIATALKLDTKKLTLALDDVRRKIDAGRGTDYAASRGEYLNGIIMANYLGYEFINPAEVIFFDENGEFMADKTDEVLSQRLKNVERAVIPGFFGAKEDGTVKTFSRGGSDITGSIVARAVKADIYENWTDVSGCLIADPRIVDNPKPINTVTYRELRELSYMGASVLHEDAIFPVRNAGIPINIKNTNAPKDPGTWIVESTCQKPPYTITGIAGKKGFCAINIEKDMMNGEIGFGRKVLQVFEENGISFEHMPSGIDTMTIIVHQSEFMEKEQRVLAGIHKLAEPDSIEMELALIAVVGRGMKAAKGTASRIFATLAHSNINVKMIDQGSSELNIIIGVKEADFETAIRQIYSIFVDTVLEKSKK